MRELVRMLSSEIKYITHEIRKDIIVIHVKSKKKEAQCPNCGRISDKVHSKYIRKLQDLPLQGKKVKLHISRNKYFCRNTECVKGAFAEKFAFFEDKATKTTRLQRRDYTCFAQTKFGVGVKVS